MNSLPDHEPRPPADNVIADLEPPHAPQAEASLLAAVWCDPTGGAVSIAQQAGLRAAAFYSPANARLWALTEDLASRQVSLGLDAIVLELQARGELADVGGLPSLLEIKQLQHTSIEVRHFAEELKLLWERRHALVLAAELRETAMTSGVREDFTGKCSELGRRLVGLGQKADLRTLKERIGAAAADVALRAAGKDDRSGWIRTGLPTFDDRLRPLNSAEEDQIVVVAGGSGHGKSALMRQLAKSALNQRMRTLILSRETTIGGCVKQMAAAEVGFDLENPDRMPPDRLRAYADFCAKMSDEWADKLLFCYQNQPSSPLVTVEDLEARVRHHCFTHGTPHLVVVDYLQLFEPRRRLHSREQEVAHVSHRLQALAREVGGCWLIGCQMNESGLKEMRTLRRERGPDGKEGKVIHRIPNAGDLRESQAIYHDADRVIALYCPPVDSRDQDQTGPNIHKPEMWLCQIKRRAGRTGIVKTWFEKFYTRFVELPSFAHAASSAPASAPTKSQWKGEHGR